MAKTKTDMEKVIEIAVKEFDKDASTAVVWVPVAADGLPVGERVIRIDDWVAIDRSFIEGDETPEEDAAPQEAVDAPSGE